MEIGGFFPYQPVDSEPNNYVEHTCPDPGDTAHLMSGRCAIYYCLRDLMLTDQKRVAYLPSYDCETVLGCFVKAGYEIHYYDFDKNLSPVFEEEMIPQISVLLVCGYYGYPTYDENFVKKCKASGVSVIVDTTHTAFSPLPACPDSDYIAVSLRKWMGVASGGLAIKRKGTFGVKPIPINKEKFSLRDQALQSRETYEHTGNEDYNKEGNDVFWKAEFMLREIFDIQEGDEASLKTILHYTFRDAIRKRQENYRYLLEHLPERSDIRPVFPYLSDDICPMFFPFFVENRDALIKHLADRHIPPKVYWPVPPFVKVEDYPGAQYIYSHIMSVSCDERFNTDDMQKIVEAFENY